MSDSIRVTSYFLVRNGVKKEADRSFYSDNFCQESCIENAKGWKPLASKYTNETTKEDIFIFDGCVVSSEEELITLLTERLSEKRAFVNSAQDAYIEKCKKSLAENPDKINLLGISDIIPGASVSEHKGNFKVYQHFTKLPVLEISPSGEIIEVNDSHMGIGF